MHDDTLAGGEEAVAGISRRDLLRKGAVVGGAGALLWAAPSITRFGGAAFGSEGTELTGFSYAAAVVTCNGEDYRVKYELEGGFEDNPGNLPHCNSGAFEDFFKNCWQKAKKVNVSQYPFTVSASQSGNTLRLTVVGDGCVFKHCGGGQSGVIKAATICDSAHVQIVDGGKAITFDTSKVGGEVKNA